MPLRGGYRSLTKALTLRRDLRSALLLFGLGFAASILPRLEYQTLSSLADGYANIEGVRAAWGVMTLVVADHVLRAVPVPAGEHTVELRYESWSLRVGLTVSLISYLALITLTVATLRRRQQRLEKTRADRAL